MNTPREVLEKLVFYYKEAVTGRTLSSDNWDKAIDQALASLQEIEQANRLTVEEIKEILQIYILPTAIAKESAEGIFNGVDVEKLAQSIYNAQNKKGAVK